MSIQRLIPVVLLLASLVSWGAQSGPAGAQPAILDPRPIALTETDLDPGFRSAPEESVFTRRPDGGLLTVAVFRRAAPTGPLLVRNTVHSLPDAQSAGVLFTEMPDTLRQQGFSAVAAGGVGNESAGFSSADDLDGSPVVYWTLVYRLESVVVITTVVGPPSSTSIDSALILARVTQTRAGSAYGLAPPATAVPTSLAPPQGPIAQPVSVPTTPAPTPTPAMLIGPPGILLSATLTEAPEIGSGLRLGGLSGLVALDSSGTNFLAVTDRGPNDVIGSGKNEKITFPEPFFVPSIVKVRLQGGELRVVERIPLRLPSGSRDPFTGSEALSGVSNGSRDDPPYTKRGRDRLPYDPFGLDLEGIAVDPRDGSYWLCEEYGPSILRVSADGTVLLRLTPRGVLPEVDGMAVQDSLPEELARRKINRGFEGIGISPDGSTLFAIMQSPLSIPTKDIGERSRNIKLVTLDVRRPDEPKVTGMYLYLAEPGEAVGTEQDDVKVGDLAALSSTRMLVAERDNAEGGPHKKIYLVDLRSATNLLTARLPRGRAIEELNESALRAAGINPVEKVEVADLGALGFSPEKLEGLAVLDDQTIAAVNDNDFGFSGFDQSDLAISSGVETRLVVVRLQRALR